MKLQTFDAENTVSRQRGDAVVSFGKNGFNMISKSAAEAMQMEKGDKIAFHQDQDNPEDWYVSHGEAGFVVAEKENTTGLVFTSKAMSATIMDALEIDAPRVSFLISKEATELDGVPYWAVITAKPIIKKKREAKKG